MQLYWVGDRYVRTQSEATKLGFGEVTEVPTDKDGLMAFLNNLHVQHQLAMASLESRARAGVGDFRREPPQFEALPIPPDAGPPPPADEDEPPAPPRPMDAGAILSRVDSPGVDVETCVEAIGKSKGYALRRYAGAVAVRFQELEKL